MNLVALRVARVACAISLALGFATVAVPAARAQQLEPSQEKVWKELSDQIEIGDRKAQEKVIRKNTQVFRDIFDLYDGAFTSSDEVDMWKRAKMLAELLDADAGGNEYTKRLAVIEALSLEDRAKRIEQYRRFVQLRSELQAAAKNRETDKLNELVPQMIEVADTLQKLNEQRLRSFALWEVAAVMRDNNQTAEAIKLCEQIDEGLTSQGYEKLRFHTDVKKEIERLKSGGGGGGDAGAAGNSDTSTSWSEDEAGKRWSDPVPLKYTADEKLPFSKITTPSFSNSEDTLQWQGWALEGNGPAKFPDAFKPLGRELTVKRDGPKIMIDEDGDGKFRDIKVISKPNLIEVEKEFEDPWTKTKVKQKYAWLFASGNEQDTMFGFPVNASPTENYFGLRFASACYLRGTVLGLELKIIDDNVSGRFGDSRSIGVPDYTKQVSFPWLDAMQIGSAKFAQPFSEYLEAGGEFYRLKMATDDEAYSVKTRKLAVDTGTVVLDFRNKLKPEALILAATDKFKGAYFNIATGKPVRLPCDRYKVAYGILRTGRKESMQSCLVVASNEMATLEVKKDTETKIELGAPFHFIFDATEVGNGDVKIAGKSVVVKGRGGELYVRFWDTPPIPESVQLYRDGKLVGKPTPMAKPTAMDYKTSGQGVLFYPLDLTLPGNGSQGALGIAMKLKKPNLLDGPIETKGTDSHD